MHFVDAEESTEQTFDFVLYFFICICYNQYRLRCISKTMDLHAIHNRRKAFHEYRYYKENGDGAVQNRR